MVSWLHDLKQRVVSQCCIVWCTSVSVVTEYKLVSSKSKSKVEWSDKEWFDLVMVILRSVCMLRITCHHKPQHRVCNHEQLPAWASLAAQDITVRTVHWLVWKIQHTHESKVCCIVPSMYTYVGIYTQVYSAYTPDEQVYVYSSSTKEISYGMVHRKHTLPYLKTGNIYRRL